jgi:general stress protein YciG
MADRDQSQTSNRGFASMDEKKQRDIASKGGQASGGNFANDPERAAEAGRKGGHNVPAEERSFSKDHELAAEAGRKGGEHSHQGDPPAYSKAALGISRRIASARQKLAAKVVNTATAGDRTRQRESRASAGLSSLFLSGVMRQWS